MLWASQNVAGDFPPILLKIFLHELYHVHEVKLCTSLFFPPCCLQKEHTSIWNMLQKWSPPGISTGLPCLISFVYNTLRLYIMCKCWYPNSTPTAIGQLSNLLLQHVITKRGTMSSYSIQAPPVIFTMHGQVIARTTVYSLQMVYTFISFFMTNKIRNGLCLITARFLFILLF